MMVKEKAGMAASARRRRPSRRRALSEEEILDAALTLLDDGGPNAAPVRGIAMEGRRSAERVYTSFPDKAAVIKRSCVALKAAARRSRSQHKGMEMLAAALRIT